MRTAAHGRGRRDPGGEAAGHGGGGLLERDHELDQIGGTLARAGAGQGCALLLEGPAGIGKSRLLAAAEERAADAGMLVLRARGGEAERDVSFGIVRQLFEVWLAVAPPEERAEALTGAAELALPLFDPASWHEPASGHTTGAEGLLHGLFWIVANLSARTPLLLAVDDVHWADHASARFLLYLLNRVEDLSLALVFARRRGEPADPLVDELCAHPGAARCSPPPLSDSAVARLVADGLAQEPAPAFTAACREATGGNPFLVRSIVRALRDDAVAPVESAAASVMRLRPDVVRQQTLVRISRLGPDALDFASCAAVLGDGALLPHVATVAEMPLERAIVAADRLAAAEVLRGDGPLMFVHPLLRVSVHDEVPPARRSELHLRAARILRSEHRPSEGVAAQLLLARRAGESWAHETLWEAAFEAMRAGNPQSAIRYLNRALEEPLERTQRGEVLLELARAEATIGSGQAEDHMREALALMDDARAQARAHLVLGSVRYTRGETAGAARSFRAGLELLGDGEDALQRDLRAAYFSAGSLVPEYAADASAGLQPLLERPPGSETRAERAALAALAALRTITGAPREQAIELARRAWSEGRLLEEEGPDGWAWSLVTAALSWSDAFQEALAICDRVIEAARRSGASMAYATASFCAQGPSYFRGDLIQARAHGQAALDLRRDGWRTYGYATAAVQSHILMDVGDLGAAEEMLGVVGVPEQGTPAGHAFAFCARARLRREQDRPREALDDALAAAAIYEQIQIANTTFAPWRLEAALAAAALDDGERARAWLAAERAVAEGSGNATHWAAVLRAEAQVEGGVRATELLRDALDRLSGSEGGLERLRCSAALGVALRRCGQRAEAREVLTDVARQAAACGARGYESRAYEELRIAGARPRRRSFSGLDALTASERRVAEMAADGLSNRAIAQALFVTSRTVEQHLYNTYKKLGIASRRELEPALRGSAAD